MNRAEFDRLVDLAVKALPREFRERLENVAIVVEEWPDEATLAEAEVDDPSELLGFYRGVPLIDRSEMAGYQVPDQILLFRQPILRECDSTGEIRRTIRETVIHEVAHHFGYDDDDLERMGVY